MSVNQDLMHIPAIQMLHVLMQLEASIVRVTQGSWETEFDVKVPMLT